MIIEIEEMSEIQRPNSFIEKFRKSKRKNVVNIPLYPEQPLWKKKDY